MRPEVAAVHKAEGEAWDALLTLGRTDLKGQQVSRFYDALTALSAYQKAVDQIERALWRETNRVGEPKNAADIYP